MAPFSNATNTLDAAIALTQAGARVIPIPRGEKAPRMRGWQDARLEEADLPQMIKPDGNLGILLGEPSSGLVDVDIDHELFHHFVDWLPATSLIHGREGNPASHRWYRTVGTVPKSMRLKAPDGTMIVELRSTGGQTVVPPSIYIGDGGTADALRWESAGEPAIVVPSVLERAINKGAAATLLALKWPALGSRHDASLALAGALLRSGWNAADAEDFIVEVAGAAGDDQAEARGANVASTQEKLQAGKQVTGIPSLKKLMDAEYVAKAAEWLGLGADAAAEEEPWAEPVLLHEPNLPDMPASLLPAPYGDYARALAQSVETPEALSVLTILSIVSTASAKKYIVVPTPGWEEPVNIYTLVALPPANNKSQVVRRCLEPLICWEMDAAAEVEPLRLDALSKCRNLETKIASVRKRAAAEKDQAKVPQMLIDIRAMEQTLHDTKVPAIPKLFVNDVTPESLASHVQDQGGRMAVISDEGGIFETFAGLYSSGKANNDIVLKGIDGGDVRIERKDRSVHIRPYLTLALIVQPKVLRNLGERQALQGKGLQERFFFAIPPSKLGYRKLNGQPVPANLSADYGTAVRALLDVELKQDKFGLDQPSALPLADDAAKIWQAWRHGIEPKLGPEGELAPCLGWGGKLAGMTLRIAGLIELMDKGPAATEICGSSMQNAVDMAKLLIPHALAAFGMMRENPAQELAERILARVRGRGEKTITKTELHRAFHGGISDVKQLDAALNLLTERAILRGDDRTTTPGKRKTRIYEINPAVLKQP